MIAVIDYGTGNLCSVRNALGRLGAEYRVTSDRKEILGADRVLLPGVGEAASAMAALRSVGLDEVLKSLTCPVLGICIGLQLMCAGSEEGDTECMGIFDARVRRFRFDEELRRRQGLKIPHMGWNTIYGLKTPLFKDMDEGAFIYYVHSYAPELTGQTIAVTDYGVEFSAALGRDNFYGTQFHPEKSGSVGERILKNFLEL